MSRFTEKLEKMELTVIPMRGLVAFPAIPLSFEIERGPVSEACEAADRHDDYIFLVSQKDISAEKPTSEDLYEVGTVSKIKQFLKLPEGNIRIVIDGLCRATVLRYDTEGEHLRAEVMCKTISIGSNGGVRGEALIQEVLTVFDNFIELLPKVSHELLLAVKSIKSPGLLADFIACNILIQYADKQKIIEEFDPLRRLELLAVIMEKEAELLKTEASIHKRVRAQIDGNQREYYLREQLKVIQNELGYNSEPDSEIDEYYEKIQAANLPDDVREKLNKEVRKLAKTAYSSAESGVLRNYLDVCLEIPWLKTSKDRIDVEAARKILDRDHDGLEKVKERILEFMAVKQLNPEIKNQILCLVGPPGTGKTSVAQSIASAMKRKYVRVSLGGVRDEADIRGHRKTYVGSMPGRIINAVVQAGTRNPLILLDEIDKLTRDSHGDPASALLEVLDGEQNKAFRDHFIEMPIDLSECMFIATANTLDTVPRPLIDRMEVIELSSYTRHEKLSIAKNHLTVKQFKRHGLNKRTLKISDDVLLEIIDFYTREAGVRNLEREIGKICRKAAKEIIETGVKRCVITGDNLHTYLGSRKILPEKISADNEIGIVNGLAFTELGGDILKIEVAVLDGTGKIELTGSLGDVMKESARTAISYIRAHAKSLNIDPDFYKTKDIHIHVPEGAVPKDGPSAGITIMTALASELSGRPVRRDIAMTGEMTLRGRVLAIGGLKEKTMAAYTAGAKTVLIPEDNECDLSEIDSVARSSLEFVLCRNANDVLINAFIPMPGAKDETKNAVNKSEKECRSPKVEIINILPDAVSTDGNIGASY
ncbi:MAG: endopeptidase La [Eubacteriales bacterium]|nr:endopeptidase La [Eubacteriales bacterium]